MNEIKRYVIDRERGDLLPSEIGDVCEWSDVEALIKQLPEGMQHCTIQFLECEKGHGRLWATNWIDHGCPTCAQEKLIKERDELRARALAAVWLLPEDVGVRELLELREEARAVFMGKDKQTIAKLQDELVRAQEAYISATSSITLRVNVVYGVNTKYPEVAGGVKHVLMINRVQRASNGGLEIEVQLP